MRMSLFLLFTCLFCVCAENAYANDTAINIKKNNAILQDILTEIENQSDYLFVYQTEVDVKQTVSINTSSNTITDVLNDLFSNTNINYTLEGTHIILSKKTPVINKSATLAVNQQRLTIKGKVVDMSNEPIIGANIIELDTKNGTVTDLDGNFTISVQPNATLLVSYIGYKSKEIQVKGQSFLTIQLQEDYQTLGEIVVVGFGTQKKENLTGAVSQVKMDDVLGSRDRKSVV